MNAIPDVICAGGGPARILAIHGIQGTRGAWLPLADALGDACTFVLPNLPGRGKAPRPASAADCTLAAFAGVVRAVVETHASDVPFVLAGWSLGVSVALAYLEMGRRDASLPMPSGLVLVSGTPHLAGVKWFGAIDPDALDAEIAARERRLGLREAADHRTVAWTWKGLQNSDQRAGLPAVGCPTLVIHGSDDEDCPLSHAAALASAIPGASLVVLPGAGHGVLTRHTDAVTAALRADLLRLTCFATLDESFRPESQ